MCPPPAATSMALDVLLATDVGEGDGAGARRAAAAGALGLTGARCATAGQGSCALGPSPPEPALQGPCRDDAGSRCLGEGEAVCSARPDEHAVAGGEGGVTLGGLGAAVGGAVTAHHLRGAQRAGLLQLPG